MNKWIAVDADEINKEIIQEIQGVRVKVSFSPYDVPRQWRCYREPNVNFFIIEFQYLLEEATHAEALEDLPVELSVGNDSQRIYRIRIDLAKCGSNHFKVDMSPESLVKNIVGAIKKFSDTVPIKLRDRYKMPEKLVVNNRNEIFSLVAA